MTDEPAPRRRFRLPGVIPPGVPATDFDRHLIVRTFCLILVIGFGALLAGLWFHDVDNNKIFDIVSEDFKLMLVALTSFLGGAGVHALATNGSKPPASPPDAPGPVDSA